MSNLIICKQKIKRQGLQNLPVPKPEKRWQPLPYHSQAKLAAEALSNHGYKIVDEDHGIAKPAIRVDEKWERVNYKDVTGPCGKIDRDGEKHQLWWRHHFGGFALTHPHVVGERRQIVFGMRNSYDQSLAASFVVGGRMMVCANLDFNAEIKISRKNTLNIQRDLPAMIDDAVSKIMGYWHSMNQRIESYQGCMVDEGEALKAIAHLVDIDALSKKDIYDVLVLFRNPAKGAEGMVDPDDYESEGEYKEKLEESKGDFLAEFGQPENGKGSLWNLYNAFTYVLKGTCLDNLPDRTMKAQVYFDSLANFEAAPVSTDLVEVEATTDEQQAEMQESFGGDDGEESGGGEETEQLAEV